MISIQRVSKGSIKFSLKVLRTFRPFYLLPGQTCDVFEARRGRLRIRTGGSTAQKASPNAVQNRRKAEHIESDVEVEIRD